MRPLLLILSLLFLATCGRPLTQNEVAFMAALQGPGFDPGPVRLHQGMAPQTPRTIPVRPRLTCQQRIFPPPQGDTMRVSTGAMAIFRNVHFRGDLYATDFLDGYPERLNLAHAMLFAHEMVHVWQWQNRDLTGYHPLKAAFEHVRTADPYLFDPATTTRFLDHGYEQQGAIMEEYVCCRTLAPEAARTKRLHDMLVENFPLTQVTDPLSQEVWVPWPEIEVEGICD